jgi:hypothetical protein
MVQFGCRSAISGGRLRISSGLAGGTGPPLAVRIDAAHAVDLLSAQALEDRRVLGVDGHDLAAARARELDELRAGHHERFLVRERERPPRSRTRTEGRRPAAPTTPCTATS